MSDASTINYLRNGPVEAPLRIALAHGAGQGMDSDFMNLVAEGLGDMGFEVLRFEFPYMARRRKTGKKVGPDPTSVLLEAWREFIRAFDDRPLIIGGKSMGGRIASMVADEMLVAGLVCLGYPFHPPGKPEKLRTEHLAGLRTPCLICQGERDPFGKREEVATYSLSGKIELCWVGDGDHSFKPRKKSGRTGSQNIELAITSVAGFANSLARPSG